MNNKLDGGPIAAHAALTISQEIRFPVSLRDYFAAAAMQTLLSDKRYSECGNEAACATEVARYAYRIANEMLAIRTTQ